MPKRATKLVGDEANFRALFRQYRKSARKRGHKFELTPARFKKLTKSNCYLCGRPPSSQYKHDSSSRSQTPYIFNGVDRLENDKGYVRGNIVACCGHCNMAKGKKSVEAFLLYVYEIYNHAIKPALAEGRPDVETDYIRENIS